MDRATWKDSCYPVMDFEAQGSIGISVSIDIGGVYAEVDSGVIARMFRWHRFWASGFPCSDSAEHRKMVAFSDWPRSNVRLVHWGLGIPGIETCILNGFPFAGLNNLL